MLAIVLEIVEQKAFDTGDQLDHFECYLEFE